MKLKSKLKLYEQFVNENMPTNKSVDQVSIDTVTPGDTVRTEVIRDVDTILNTLTELSDRIGTVGESTELESEINDLFEELFELTNLTSVNEGLLDFIKSPIKFTKIKANLKKYQKALVQSAINDLDFAKKKEATKEKTDADDWKKKLEVLDQANKAKNQALTDQSSAISDRIKELTGGDEGLAKVASLGKTKAKLTAAKTVMKATSGEEAKQLKLEISTLEDRISKDTQSLKDYASTQDAPASGQTSAEAEASADAQSKSQMSDKDDAKKVPSANDDEVATKKAADKKKKDDKIAADKVKADEKKETAKVAVEAAQAKYDEVKDGDDEAKKLTANIELLKAKLKQDDVDDGNDLEKSKKLTADLGKAQEDLKALSGSKNLKVATKPVDKDGKPIVPKTPNENESLDTPTGDDLNEATLSGLQSYSDEEDEDGKPDYSYIKDKGKEIGVEVTIDIDPFGDGYDEMTMTGDKGSIMKLAGMTGHADFVKDGTYEIEESVTVNEATDFVKEFKKYGDFKYDRNDGSTYTQIKSKEFGSVSIRIKPEDKADEIFDDMLFIELSDDGKGIYLTGLKNIKAWFNGGGLDHYAYSDVKEIEEYNDDFKFERIDESTTIELPKTIKLDEGLTIAQRFAKLM